MFQISLESNRTAKSCQERTTLHFLSLEGKDLSLSWTFLCRRSRLWMAKNLSRVCLWSRIAKFIFFVSKVEKGKWMNPRKNCESPRAMTWVLTRSWIISPCLTPRESEFYFSVATNLTRFSSFLPIKNLKYSTFLKVFFFFFGWGTVETTPKIGSSWRSVASWTRCPRSTRSSRNKGSCCAWRRSSSSFAWQTPKGPTRFSLSF